MSYINPVSRNEHYHQRATYWSQKKLDGFGGETWEAPIVISCRWEDMRDEALSVAYRVEGESIISDAHVFTTFPLMEGGYLYLGETSEANPSRLQSANRKAYPIRKTATTPSLRTSISEYVAFL